MPELQLIINRIKRDGNSVTPAFCLDDCIATYAAAHGVDFRVLYCSCMKAGFDAQNTELPIGKRLIFGFEPEEELKDRLGIFCRRVAELAAAPEAIATELAKGNPVQLNLDGFYCPWDWRFGVIEGEMHSLLIVGEDAETGDYICTDPYYDKPRVLLSRENFEAGFGGLLIYEVKAAVSIDCEALLSKCLDEPYPANCVSLDEMAKAVAKGFELPREIEDYCDDMSIDRHQNRFYLNVRCKELAHNRIRFAAFLEYLAETSGKTDFMQLSDECAVLAQRWDLFRMQMLRRVFSKKHSEPGEYIAQRMSEVLAEEKRLTEALRAVVGGEMRAAVQQVSDADGVCTTINIERYFNCEGIGEGAAKTDFNEDGECFLADSFPSGEQICIGDAGFVLAEKVVGRPDNICCRGQSIEINRCCTEMLLLGCSDYEQCAESVRLVYDSGDCENQTLIIDDWLPDYGRVLANEVGRFSKITRYPDGDYDTDDEGVLYLVTLRADSDRVLDIIELPECEHMHIFALSVLEIK